MRDLSDNGELFQYDYTGERPTVGESGRSGSGLFGISSGLFVLLMFCAVVLSFGLVLFKIVIAEREAAQREIRSVERVFENHKSLLLKEMERYAASNAAYVNVETSRSFDWITERFGVDMALDFAHDYTALVDGSLNVIYAANHSGAETSDFYLETIEEQIAGTLDDIRANYTGALVRTAGGDIRFAGSLPDISSVDIIDIEGRPHYRRGLRDRARSGRYRYVRAAAEHSDHHLRDRRGASQPVAGQPVAGQPLLQSPHSGRHDRRAPGGRRRQRPRISHLVSGQSGVGDHPVLDTGSGRRPRGDPGDHPDRAPPEHSGEAPAGAKGAGGALRGQPRLHDRLRLARLFPVGCGPSG
jgi:hypothetical protein